MDSGWDHRALPRWDCSIRTHPDQRLLTAPRTLSWSTTSFFGCWRQGIHTYALCSLTYIGSSKPTTAAASRLTSSGARLTYFAVRFASPPAGALENRLPVLRFVNRCSRRLGSREPRRLIYSPWLTSIRRSRDSSRSTLLDYPSDYICRSSQLALRLAATNILGICSPMQLSRYSGVEP